MHIRSEFKIGSDIIYHFSCDKVWSLKADYVVIVIVGVLGQILVILAMKEGLIHVEDDSLHIYKMNAI